MNEIRKGNVIEIALLTYCVQVRMPNHDRIFADIERDINDMSYDSYAYAKVDKNKKGKKSRNIFLLEI